MIKIKLYELDKHRNECAFRPYLAAQHILREIGIEFTQGDSYDYAWIAQASFTNKKVSLSQSIDEGLEFLSKISGDYMLLDGQDSTSLIGTYDVFRDSDALLLMKNSLLKDKSLYNQGWNAGRMYWGSGNYMVTDYETNADRVTLSGTNWLSTHCANGLSFMDINLSNKHYDVSAMFQYPFHAPILEYTDSLNNFYDTHRRVCINNVNKLKCNVSKLVDGVRLSQQEYYHRMMNSKIIIAPYGAGEMAPRDIESAQYAAILIKPDMSYIETAPDIYEAGVTYISCAHDYSDLSEKIDEILGNYQHYSYIIENMRARIIDKLSMESLALHMYKMFTTKILN